MGRDEKGAFVLKDFAHCESLSSLNPIPATALNSGVKSKSLLGSFAVMISAQG